MHSQNQHHTESGGTLSLVSCASKILTIIIYHQTEKKTEENLQEDQFGSQRNQGALKAILLL